MSLDHDVLLARARAAAVDGRTANTRFQQDQLIRLHRNLCELREQICHAISQDQQIPLPEAEVEYAFTVATIRDHYDSIDFDQVLQEEYKVANGCDAPLRRTGYGTVVIRPTDHTRFFSILSLVGAAITAGNSFVIEVRYLESIQASNKSLLTDIVI